MPYDADISRDNPTCFLFLLDQSKSMLEQMAGGAGKTKAQAVADAINRLLYDLCHTCVKGRLVLNRFSVGVLGYGQQIVSRLGGTLAGRDLVPVSDLAYNPLRLDHRPDPDGGPLIRFPVWIEPQAQGRTPMCATLERARGILADFLAEHPNCHPPIVLNLTDGAANDGDPEAVAVNLRRLSSSDGNVLLLNAHISARGEPGILFPDNESSLPDAFARKLFRMSSLLPPPMLDLAQQSGYRTSPATRGFVFNANLDAVVQFLNIGTTISRKNLPVPPRTLLEPPGES